MSGLTEHTLSLLLNSTGTRAAARILDLGCGDGSVALDLRSRGYEVVAMDDDLTIDSDEAIVGSPAAAIPVESRSVSLALIRGTESFIGAFDRGETYVATANLLATMEPNGSVVIATRSTIGGADAAAATPLQSAAIDLLVRFGLTATLQPIAERPGLIGRLLGKSGQTDCHLVVGTMPATTMSKLEYHAIAREAAMTPVRAAA